MGTRYQGAPREVRALNAYIKLMRAAESLAGRMSRRLGEQNLTLSQFGALEALFHLGPLNQCDLGLKLLKSSGNITLVVDNLAKRGLVRRERGVQDRRFVTIHLTDEGRRVIRGILPGHVQAIVDEMDVLGAAEQEELGRLCRKVGVGSAQAPAARRAASGGSRVR
jgi:MarR family 2-MHQ and catechol resistance regulon transcriptional repressor